MTLTTHSADDRVASFQLDGAPVRGRIARLGDGVIDPILKRHDYPRWAAHFLGEALTLAVLTSASLKFDGRITIQAEGDGPISMLVAEARSDGGVRGYLRLNRELWDRLDRVNKGARPHVPQAIGRGVMAMILVPDDENLSPYQGLVPIDGATLEDCAEAWFAQSEQIPTRVRLAVAEISEPGGTRRWRSGGALLQQVAADDARGDTADIWETARSHFATLTDLELADPDMASDRVLYRLFHEVGVRLEPAMELVDRCTCSEQKLRAMLASMPTESVASLAEADGMITADCQFCSRVYRFAAADV
ncbi:Hsp33 family molecular chaperone HslO [bacterium]|nr:Hsp33 family molecular chaperone HslO [bacterium]